MIDKGEYVRDDAAGEGTSFHDVEVTASLPRLTELFGAPGPGDGGYKVHHEWGFSGPNGDVTLYDFKYDGAYEGYWHVGARDKIACLAFKRWVIAQL